MATRPKVCWGGSVGGGGSVGAGTGVLVGTITTGTGVFVAVGAGKLVGKGVLVGDAATRLKQTLMFDLPLVDKAEIQALMKADVIGGGKRESR